MAAAHCGCIAMHRSQHHLSRTASINHTCHAAFSYTRVPLRRQDLVTFFRLTEPSHLQTENMPF